MPVTASYTTAIGALNAAKIRADADPTDTTLQRILAHRYEIVAAVLHGQGACTAAVAAYIAALSIVEALGATDPTITAWRRDRAFYVIMINDLCETIGRVSRASTAAAAALTHNGAKK